MTDVGLGCILRYVVVLAVVNFIMDNTLFSKINLKKKGLQRILGKLEAVVMQEVWQLGEASVRQVYERLKDKGLAYTTVMTVMSRLASKKILAKEMQGNAFIYKPCFSAEEVNSALVKELSKSFKGLSAPALLHFIDNYQTDYDTLQKLEELLAAKKAQLKEQCPED